MAISFPKIRKIEFGKYLINVLLITVLFSAIFYLRKYFVKEIPIELPSVEKKIRIDFNLLERQMKFLERLRSFEEIKKFEGEKGRENPFIPY